MRQARKQIVVITRPQSISGSSEDLLRQFAPVHAEVRWVPLIALETLRDGIQEGDFITLQRTSPSCLAFTSGNAVEAFSDALRRFGTIPRALRPDILLAAQGEETARIVEVEFGRSPSFVPSVTLSHAFGDELAAYLEQPCTVFHPTSRAAGIEFDARVTAGGHPLVRWNLYTPVPRVLTPEERSLFDDDREEDLILVLMSPSAVREAKRQLPPHGHGVWKRLQIVTIGPVTSAAVCDAGWTVGYESPDHSVQGLVRVLNDSVLVGGFGD